jgi:hypothetical protein
MGIFLGFAIVRNSSHTQLSSSSMAAMIAGQGHLDRGGGGAGSLRISADEVI